MSFIDQPGFADDVRSVLTDLLGLPPAFMNYITQYNALNGLPIPISQITGFTQFTAQDAPTINTLESTTSSTYANLATVGPQLTGLANGKYVIFFGCLFDTNNAGFGANMSVQVNSTTPTTGTDDLTTLSTSMAPGSYALIKTLNSNNSNTLTAKYYTGGGATASFRNRWMIALKFANL